MVRNVRQFDASRLARSTTSANHSKADELVAVIKRATGDGAPGTGNERLRGELALSRTLVFRVRGNERAGRVGGSGRSRDSTVLITARVARGKERLAEAIVRASRRAASPLCASIVPR